MANENMNGEKTIINNTTSIVGDITAKENFIINGTVNGNIKIRGHNLLLGPKGRIDGNVDAQNVKILGHMTGDIKATGKVEITKDAHYSGNITSKGITVENGANFNASVKLG